MSPRLQTFIEENSHLLKAGKLKDFYIALRNYNLRLNVEFVQYLIENNLEEGLLKQLGFIPTNCYVGCTRPEVNIPKEVNKIGFYAFSTYNGRVNILGDNIELDEYSMVDIGPDCTIHTKPSIKISGDNSAIKIFKKHQVEDL